MNTLIRIALLLGLLGVASGATLAKVQNIEFAPKDGCKYGAQQVSERKSPIHSSCCDDSVSFSNLSPLKSSRNVPLEWNASRMQATQKVEDAIVTHSGSNLLHPCHLTTTNGTMVSRLTIAATTTFRDSLLECFTCQRF